MPLLLPTLQNGLHDLFVEPPLLEDAISRRWGEVLEDYLSGLTVAPPGWTASVLPPLIQAFVAAMAGHSMANQFLPKLSAALTALAGGVAAAQSTIPATAGLAPASPLSVTLSNTISASQAAIALATAIDLWFRTGSVSTGGPSSPWS